MGIAEEALGQRIREMRRRHFGRGGKARFAEALGVPVSEYERFERGRLPDGELLVRMCEIAGEDLQWLLTGRAARGTVVISGTQRRHQDLLARVARVLDRDASRATQLEAFLDLLEADPPPDDVPALPSAPSTVPIFEAPDTPASLPGSDAEGAPLLPRPDAAALDRFEEHEVVLSEPTAATDANMSFERRVRLLTPVDEREGCRCLRSPVLARAFDNLFGVVIPDDRMQPMFRPGDVALLTPAQGPALGRPAVCRLADGSVNCRIWLGQAPDERLQLARLTDGAVDRIDAASVSWSLEALYRVRAA